MRGTALYKHNIASDNTLRSDLNTMRGPQGLRNVVEMLYAQSFTTVIKESRGLRFKLTIETHIHSERSMCVHICQLASVPIRSILRADFRARFGFRIPTQNS